MDKTRRLQIAKQLRAAAQKLGAVLPAKVKGEVAGELESFLQSYNFAKKSAVDAKEAAQIANHLDRVVAAFKKHYPTESLDTDVMYKVKDLLDTAQQMVKMGVKLAAKDQAEALKQIHKAYGRVSSASLLLEKEQAAVKASTVSAKFTVLLLGEKAGTAETLAEVPGPDAKRAVQQALKLVVDPQFDLSLPENKPKVKVEQRQAPEGPVDVAWVSFDQYTNLLILPSGSAKNWKQIAIRQGGQSLPAKATVKAAAGVKVEKQGQLKDGIWEGESISFTVSLSEILDDLGLKYAAKWAKDGSYEVSDAPSARELTDYGEKTSSEAITCFPDAARHAYMTAMESGVEAYLAKSYSEGVINLLNEVNGTADYEGEDSNGEPAVVKQNYSVTAKETGDVDGIYSDPYIKITVDEPLHLNNGPLADLRITSPLNVDEGYGAQSLAGDLAAYLKEEFSSEVKNIEDTDLSNADMDKDVFDEFFVENVLQMDPGEIAECIQTYASDSDESVEDVVDTMMKDIPGLDKLSGAIASALEGGYDARQQKLPLKGAAKALAAAEAAIKAADNPIANIREKRAAAAKRGDSKAVSYWNEKLRNAMSKGPAPSSTTKSKVGGLNAAKQMNLPEGVSPKLVKDIQELMQMSKAPVRPSQVAKVLKRHNPGTTDEDIEDVFDTLARFSKLHKTDDGKYVAYGSSMSAARKLTPNQQKKLDEKRVEKAYYKVAQGVQIDMMNIPKIFKVGEKAIAEGADDAALEKAISDFVETIREN